MPKVYLVFDGQFGSTGKGAVVGFLADHLRPAAVVRTGGPNAGHSITIRRGVDQSSAVATRFAMRQIPCAWHIDGCKLIIGAGSLVKMDVLHDEINLIDKENPEHGPVLIDNQAVIMDKDAGEQEDRLKMNAFNGSTSEGIGWTRSQYMLRKSVIARDCAELTTIPGVKVCDTVDLLNNLVNDYPSGRDIIIESSQGFGLSLMLSGHYPFTTSRDLTPMQILNDVGLHWDCCRIPTRAKKSVYTIAVCRTFPIRVAGNSGMMKNELSWEDMSRICGKNLVPEKTTVTKRVRRIAWFDPDEIRRMHLVCKPDGYFLTFADYVDSSLYPEGGNLKLTPDRYRDKVVSSALLDEWLHRYFHRAVGSTGPSYVSVGPGWFVRTVSNEQNRLDFRVDSNPVLYPSRAPSTVSEV